MNSKIEKALVDHLKTIALSPEPQIVENVEDSYKPTIGEAYLEARYLPAPTNTLAVGEGRDQYNGILQVTVVAPRNEGVEPAMAIADEVIRHFKKHTIIDGDGVRVKINRQPSQASPAGDGAWLRVPVSIVYNCMA